MAAAEDNTALPLTEDAESPPRTERERPPLSTGQVIRLLGVSEHWINNRIRHGDLEPPPIETGRRWWFRDDVERARALWASWGRR